MSVIKLLFLDCLKEAVFWFYLLSILFFYKGGIMSAENEMFVAEKEAGILQTADAFIKVFKMESLVKARNLAEQIARFSETPIEIHLTDSEDKGKAMRLFLTACGRELSLGFSESGKVEIEYDDGSLRQTSQIRNVPLTNIISSWGSNNTSRLLILLGNSGSVEISKGFGRVIVVGSSLSKPPTM